VGIRQWLGAEDEEAGKEQGSVENRLCERQREYCQEDGSSSEPADGCPANSSAVGEPPSEKISEDGSQIEGQQKFQRIAH